MKTFQEWLTEAVGEEDYVTRYMRGYKEPQKFGQRSYGPYDSMISNPEKQAFMNAIHDVIYGIQNQMANAHPAREAHINFTDYMDILIDAQRHGYGRQFGRGLQQAFGHIESCAQKFVEAKRRAGFQEGPEFREGMKRAWDEWMRAMQILRDIEKDEQSAWYRPTPGRLSGGQ